MVQVIPDSRPWFFSAIYASNEFQTKTRLGEELINISRSFSRDWIIGGDFNVIMKGTENFGGKHISNFISNLFK